MASNYLFLPGTLVFALTTLPTDNHASLVSLVPLLPLCCRLLLTWCRQAGNCWWCSPLPTPALATLPPAYAGKLAGAAALRACKRWRNWRCSPGLRHYNAPPARTRRTTLRLPRAGMLPAMRRWQTAAPSAGGPPLPLLYSHPPFISLCTCTHSFSLLASPHPTPSPTLPPTALRRVHWEWTSAGASSWDPHLSTTLDKRSCADSFNSRRS